MLNVVHISTSSFGGAGKAAFRLHEGMLNRTDINSTFITADTIYNPGPHQINITLKKINVFYRIANRLGIYLLNAQRNYHRLKCLSGNFEIFSMPTTDYTLEKLEVIKNADIIHLHWIANFINYPSFFKAFKHKPIVWTLHDMNPFMGGFHYKNDYLNNKSYHALESYLVKIKYNAIQKAENLHVIAPSNWLMNEAVNSGMFKSSTQYRVIPNSINLEIFKPIEKKEARIHLSITDDLPCILMVAEYYNHQRKGFDLLIEALMSIDSRTFQVISVGSNKFNFDTSFRVTELGILKSEKLFAMAYSSADLFVLPSREDNLPNVMLESFACGTPVLSFKTGGMQDWIIPDFNGLFANSTDAEGLKIALENFIKTKQRFDSKKIREFAIANFSQQEQASNYNDIYQSLIN